jgi:hypothetical protein
MFQYKQLQTSEPDCGSSGGKETKLQSGPEMLPQIFRGRALNQQQQTEHCKIESDCRDADRNSEDFRPGAVEYVATVDRASGSASYQWLHAECCPRQVAADSQSEQADGPQ